MWRKRWKIRVFRTSILKTEIRQDAGRGDVTAKQEELAELEQRAEHASSVQLDTLGEADSEIRNAQVSHEAAEKADDKKTEKADDKKTEKEDNKAAGSQKKEEEQKRASIDIRL